MAAEGAYGDRGTVDRGVGAGVLDVVNELPEELRGVVGAPELFTWFGYWPSFHDAEIVSLELRRRGTSRLTTHTWGMTGDIDQRGYYMLDKHVVVTFCLEGITGLELMDFSKQNVIFGLSIRQLTTGFELRLDGCYGLAGTLLAEQISIEMAPGDPAD